MSPFENRIDRSPDPEARQAIGRRDGEISRHYTSSAHDSCERLEDNCLAWELRRHSIGYDDNVFIRFPDRAESLTFGAFFDSARRIASYLRNSGVRPGDRIAVQVEKSVEALELYLGAVFAGGVFLPLNPSYTISEMSYFIGDASPRILVCDPAKLDGLRPAAEKAKVETVLTLDGSGQGTLARRSSDATPLRSPVKRGPDDLAAILYTSGTTGRPKGAMLSHDNLASNSATLKKTWNFSESDALIHALPIFHTHGLFVATNVAFMARSSLVFLPRFEAKKIIEAMPLASAFMGVPTYYTRLLAEPGVGAAARGMRLFVSGSAPLLTATHEGWRRATGHSILERYGMTETSMITSNPYKGERRAGTVGKPLEGVDVRIRDAGGNLAASDEPGAIEVRGRNVFMGYWRMREATRKDFRDDGFFITGDIGSASEDGYISIVGRARDVIICGGFNVYPKEVEALIDAIDGVVESAVFGVPHPDLGEAGVAAVVARGGIAISQIDDELRMKLARYKCPRKILLVDELPRNSMGKVQKAELQRVWANLFQASALNDRDPGLQQ